MFQPNLGRWMQTDPIEFAAGDLDLYRGFNNDPVITLDALGLFPGLSWGYELVGPPKNLNDVRISYEFQERISPPLLAAKSIGATQNWQLNDIIDYRIPRGSVVGVESKRHAILDVVNLNPLPRGFWVDTREIKRNFPQNYWFFVEITNRTLGFNPADVMIPEPKGQYEDAYIYDVFNFFNITTRDLRDQINLTDIYVYIDTSGPGTALGKQLMNLLFFRLGVTNNALLKLGGAIEKKLAAQQCGVLEALYTDGGGVFFG